MAQTKKITLRRCVGCGQMIDRAGLIRVIRTPQGSVILDMNQKGNGRGAYVCRSLSCIETAVKRRGFERALKCKVDKEIFDELRSMTDPQED